MNSEQINLASIIKQREDNYLNSCTKYQSSVDPGVFVTIRNELQSYTPSIKLTDNDLLSICEVFKTVDHLRVLNLRECDISCNGAYLLCELLRRNTAIEVIDLRYNKISDLGAQALSEILQIKETKLKTLILHYNQITERGAFHIAQGLRMNTVLEELDVSHNSLGSYGAKIIRAALMERSMLLSTSNRLAIEHNPHSNTIVNKANLIKYNLEQNVSPSSRSAASSNSSNSVDNSDRLSSNYDNYDNADKTPKPPKKSIKKRRKRKKTKNKVNANNSDNNNIETDEKMSNSPDNFCDNIISRRTSSALLRSPYRPSKQLLEKWVSPAQLTYMQQQLGIWINFEGNFLKEEVFNSITHGLGFLLSILATAILMRYAQYHSLRCQVACGIFCFTLFFMYLSSTLYHSFVYIPCARHVFHVLDFSSIFLLIAGTYTPILLIGFAHSPFHSLILFILMWSIAICGVTYSSYADPHDAKWKKLTTLYLFMSYSGLICVKPFIETFDPMAWVWIALGGVFYTAGVWFIANDGTVPIFHAIWHLCVIFGSACHFWCILWYIVPMDSLERPTNDLTLAHIIDNFCFGLKVSEYFTFGSDQLL